MRWLSLAIMLCNDIVGYGSCSLARGASLHVWCGGLPSLVGSLHAAAAARPRAHKASQGMCGGVHERTHRAQEACACVLQVSKPRERGCVAVDGQSRAVGDDRVLHTMVPRSGMFGVRMRVPARAGVCVVRGFRAVLALMSSVRARPAS